MKLIDILVEELPKSGGWLRDVKTMTQDMGGNIWGYDCVIPRLKGGLWSSKSGDDLVRDSKIEACNLAVDWNTAIITREQYEAALAAKNGGWIEWGGGECPVPRGTLVDVKYLCGDVNLHIKAGEHDSSGSIDTAFAVRWSKLGAEYDIIAYRLHQPQEAVQAKADEEADLNECIGQDAAPVWSGDGLPQAGCECEYQYKVHGSEWHPLECVAVDGKAVFGWSNNTPVALQSNTHNFRPIRSEADKKREAICDAIYGALTKAERQHNRSDEAEAVYDAIAAGKIPGVKLED